MRLKRPSFDGIWPRAERLSTPPESVLAARAKSFWTRRRGEKRLSGVRGARTDNSARRNRDSVLRSVQLNPLIRDVRCVAERRTSAASVVCATRATSGSVGSSTVWAGATSPIRRNRLLNHHLADLRVAQRGRCRALSERNAARDRPEDEDRNQGTHWSKASILSVVASSSGGRAFRREVSSDRARCRPAGWDSSFRAHPCRDSRLASSNSC